ncbi:MAG: AraC family transcriptional regulator [Crocinitomicaceae bacterium]
MGLIASLKDIDLHADSVFVMHEKSEKLIPLHTHIKGQLGFVEGGIAYITVESKTYVVPTRHYFWIPQGIPHVLKIAYSATVLRSLYFYSFDDEKDLFYSKLGIYPASELLIQMINHTEIWDSKSVRPSDANFEFLVALKNLLPQLNKISLPMVLPITDDERTLKIINYMEKNISEQLSLNSISQKFNMSERTLSRLFQSNLHVSFLQYLKTIRVLKALEMIVKTDKSISEIAYSVGYETLGAFSNTFFSITQSRPTDIRKHSTKN